MDYLTLLKETCEKCEYFNKRTGICKVCFGNDEFCDQQIEWLRLKGINLPFDDDFLY